MDDEKMLKHNKTKKVLKTTGVILTITGLVFTVIPLVSLFSSINSNDFEMPKFFWMLFLGFPLIGIGMSLTILGFKRGIMTYMKNEGVPVINEAVNDLGGAFTSAASSFKKGFSGAHEVCSCGAVNKKDSAFCGKCGKSLSKKCNNCGFENGSEAVFCNKCGTKMSS